MNHMSHRLGVGGRNFSPVHCTIGHALFMDINTEIATVGALT